MPTTTNATTQMANKGSVYDIADDITVGDICVPLKEIFYITDLAIINKEFAQKVKENEL